MTYTRLLGVAAAMGVLLLSGCTSEATTEGRSAAPSRPALSSAASGPQVAMTETHRYADGVTVGVKGFTDATLGLDYITEDDTAKEGDPYVIATLVWANKSSAKLEFNPLIVVKSGPAATPAPRVYVDVPNSVILDPGASTEYDVGAIVPAAERDAVIIEITDALNPSRAVTFAGAID